ncbi:uncharacterized protein CMU_019520 [Cryptosporidium muris RN66]|uniref:A-kinase anchor protein 7-like phosphoesterase domain-containing protein n=1 Tax=Cryptosporidium muris (strain RN66) TaxID=441375 RepID=B6ACD9_CRYMR|nr:uncharacterized protein CMU_019520 [Cryptosporidium muris RN66]EEA06195.1 hypothetical protein, conserved [Cryptosporidium muris RN66]|eukprot:XP_002140544.1 hypothetical protein [Cryptosporidium muris RN66]
MDKISKEDFESFIYYPFKSTKTIVTDCKSAFSPFENIETKVPFVDLSRIPKDIMRLFSQNKNPKEIQVEESEDFESLSEGLSEASEIEENLLTFSSDIYEENKEYFVKEKLKANQNILEIKSYPPTHFICLPFDSKAGNFHELFRKFKDRILKSVEFGEVNSEYFIGESRLHLTLGLVSCETPSKIESCIKALKSIRESEEFNSIANKIRKSDGLGIKLKGLFSFGNPEKTRVVYTVIQEHQIEILIRRLWNRILEQLKRYDIKLVDINSSIKSEEFNNNFKPHITLINTKYGKYRNSVKHEDYKTHSKTINVTNLLNMYTYTSFGIGYTTCIQLNELRSYLNLQNKGVDKNIYNSDKPYNCIYSLKFIQ